MNMNRREQALVVVVAALAVVFVGYRVVDRTFRGPLRAKQTAVAGLEKTRDDREQRWNQVVKSQEALTQWRKRSLPPDTSLAQNLYMNWLVALVERSGLEKATVSPNAITPKGDVYDRLPYTIKSFGTMEALARFLYDFYRADLLHQVRTMTVTPQRQEGRQVLSINLTVEALVVKGAEPRDTLFPEDEAEASSGRLAMADFEDYAAAFKKPLFTAYVAPRQEPDSIDAAKFVYLTATLEVGDTSVAWLYDRTNNRRYWLRPGQAFDVAGVSGKVVSVAVLDRTATLEINDQQWILPLGKNLREIQLASRRVGE